MTALTDKLESRGYWRVEIRPSVFKPDRVANTHRLQQTIEKARVELRGWDFPHIGKSWDLPESQDWVGVEIDWSAHVEVWRAFRSGQFVYRGGVWTDWLDQHHFRSAAQDWRPGTRLPLVSTLWSVTEFCEFAARYSQTEAGGDEMIIDLSFHGLKGRHLHGDHERRVWFDAYGPARMDTFSFIRGLPRASLIAGASQLAVDCTGELFAAFGYSPGAGLLEEIQAELLRRPGA